jgi:CubicO group peptidase (beta-lactamase class C family)
MAAYDEVLSYAEGQATTGFLVMRDDQIVAERNWGPAPDAPPAFFNHGVDAHGARLEDVASQQKSFMAILAGIAADKGLLDVEKPLSTWLGTGWSKAALEQEAEISLLNLLRMNTGLKIDFSFEAQAGSTFFYNTPVYAALKRVLEIASGQGLNDISRQWLTGPAEMNDTDWRDRGAAGVAAGNPVGLVTSPRDVAKLGQIVLHGGLAANGGRILSRDQLDAMLTRSATNPAYGRLWWLNGGAWAVRPIGPRSEGPMIPAAPADLVAALGAMGRKLYVVRSERLVVVRLGQTPPDADFDQQIWLRLSETLGT